MIPSGDPRDSDPPSTGPRASRAAGTGEIRLLAHVRDEFGRIRPVRVGPEGWIWFGTSNRDGRGSPAPSDDRLIRVDPGALDRG